MAHIGSRVLGGSNGFEASTNQAFEDLLQIRKLEA